MMMTRFWMWLIRLTLVYVFCAMVVDGWKELLGIGS